VNLRGLDRVLALATWLAAAVLVVMLFAGPAVIAEDKGKKAAVTGGSPYAGGAKAAAPDGAALFKDSCGSCHTLSAAGTSGAVGPKLDGLALDAAVVTEAIRSGPGLMPSFTGQLSPEQIDAVAAYVAKASG
jgi:mono/diheme cytochrome c family protein